MATGTIRRNTTSKKTRTPKMTYCWGSSKTEGNATQKQLLGGKGANLAEMTILFYLFILRLKDINSTCYFCSKAPQFIPPK